MKNVFAFYFLFIKRSVLFARKLLVEFLPRTSSIKSANFQTRNRNLKRNLDAAIMTRIWFESFGWLERACARVSWRFQSQTHPEQFFIQERAQNWRQMTTKNEEKFDAMYDVKETFQFNRIRALIKPIDANQIRRKNMNEQHFFFSLPNFGFQFYQAPPGVDFFKLTFFLSFSVRNF